MSWAAGAGTACACALLAGIGALGFAQGTSSPGRPLPHPAGRSAGQSWQQSTQALLGQLSGSLLPSLLASAPALAGASTASRRLQEQQQEGGRKHALAGRFHQLRADRVALRGRLRHAHARARNRTTGAAPATRQLQQEGAAAAPFPAPLEAPQQPAAAVEELPLLVQEFDGDGEAAAYWDAAAAYQQGYADGVADVYLRESGQLWAGGEDAADAALWPELERAAPGELLLVMQVRGWGCGVLCCAVLCCGMLSLRSLWATSC